MTDYKEILRTKIAERNTLNKEIELLEQLQELKNNNGTKVDRPLFENDNKWHTPKKPKSYIKKYRKEELDRMSSSDIQNIICNNIVRIVYIKKSKRKPNEKRIFEIASFSTDFVYKKWGNAEYTSNYSSINRISILEKVDSELHYKNLVADNIFKIEIL